MKSLLHFLAALWIAALACGPVPGSQTINDVQVTITTFVDEYGNGALPESYVPLPNTLVIAKWNIHGGMYREVKLTDRDGRADFSVGYTHFFDVSAVPQCGYYSTTPLLLDLREKQAAEFGFWPAGPVDQRSGVKVMVWRDANSNGGRSGRDHDEQASVMFNVLAAPAAMSSTMIITSDLTTAGSISILEIHADHLCASGRRVEHRIRQRARTR
jgi:hypothetical protein